MKKYNLRYKFFNTQEEAQNFCSMHNASATAYMRKKHPANFTPWRSKDGSENLFVCWYYQ